MAEARNISVEELKQDLKPKKRAKQEDPFPEEDNVRLTEVCTNKLTEFQKQDLVKKALRLRRRRRWSDAEYQDLRLPNTGRLYVT